MPGDINPLLSLYNFGSRVGKQVELRRHEQARVAQSMAMIAANHHAVTLQTQQKHDLGQEAATNAAARTESAASAEHSRKTAFAKSLIGHVEPGTNFTIKTGDTTISGTKKAKKPKAAQPPQPKVPPRARPSRPRH